jgi:hypothetical protein
MKDDDVSARRACPRREYRARCCGPLLRLGAALLLLASPVSAQQFAGDNQWVAPHGVGTFLLTLGQAYSAFMAVAALLPETEFNLGVTRFTDKPLDVTEGYYSGIFYVKRRLMQNEAGNAGWALSVGTGVDPSHVESGTQTHTFQSWFANTSFTFAFFGGDVTWDVIPGVTLNLDMDQENDAAWGMTWASRAAVYKVIPHSAMVGEVYGTAGEAYATPSYRAGVRWESSRVIVAATYGNSFTGSGSPGFEIGGFVLTNQIFCLGKCKVDPDW